MDESEIFVFGRVGDSGANKEEMEAAMTSPGELALTLGVNVLSAAGRRLKSRPLLRNSGQKCRRWVPSWFDVQRSDRDHSTGYRVSAFCCFRESRKLMRGVDLTKNKETKTS
eukprot:scaffold5636_cov73-Cyclotella_meneghiniana.AAC.8